MTENEDTRTGLLELLLIATGTTLVLLLVEWLMLAGLGLDHGQEEVARSLQGFAIAALAIGAGSAMLVRFVNRWFDDVAAAVAASAAMLMMLDMYSRVAADLLYKLLGTVGVAVAVFLLVARLIQTGPAFLRCASAWWAMAAALYALTLLLTTTSAVDSTGIWLAAGVAVIAAVLLLRWLRAERKSMLLPSLSLSAMLVAAVVLGMRIPVWQPDNNFAEGKPGVLLVTIDTLRADHVGAYGYERARTPNLDALAQEGILFRQAVTANVYTGPSHASILTGLYPESHGVLVNHMLLPQDFPTLADMLREEGYLTAAYVSGYTTKDSACGLPSRFHAYDDDIRAWRWLPESAQGIGAMKVLRRVAKALGRVNGDFGQAYRMGADTADAAIAWLDNNGGRPFFVWTHFFDPHIPYRPPLEYQEGPDAGVSGHWYGLDSRQRSAIVASGEKVDAMIGLYDAEVAYSDVQLGRVVRAARDAAPDSGLLIIVTSDHGESMGEHGLYWFRDLHDPNLLVPLVIVPPDVASMSGRSVEAQVGTIDLVPTVLDMLEVDSSIDLDGVSLTGLMNGNDSNSTGPVFSGQYPTPGEFEREGHAVREGGWKLIRTLPGWEGVGATHFKPVSLELYHIEADAAELHDQFDTQPDMGADLGVLLAGHERPDVKPELELLPDEREKLRSLGYVH